MGIGVASQACSKLEGSGIEFGPKTGLSHFWVRGGVIFCPAWCRQAGPGTDTAGFISLQIGAMTTGSSSMTVPWTVRECG